MARKKPPVVTLAGELGIRDAAALKQRLLAALSQKTAVRLEAGALTGIDAAIVQLLVAARRSAVAAGVTITVDAPQDGVLVAALARLGLAAPRQGSGPFAVLEVSQGEAA